MHEQKHLYLLYSQQTHLFYHCTCNFPVAFFVSETQTQEVLGVFRKKANNSSGVNTENYSGGLVQLRSVEFFLGLSFGRQGEGNVPAELPGQCGLRGRLVKSNRTLLWASSPHVFICWGKKRVVFFLGEPRCAGFVRKEGFTPFSALLFFFSDCMQQFVSETYIFFSSTQTITVPADNIPVVLRIRFTCVMSPL